MVSPPFENECDFRKQIKGEAYVRNIEEWLSLCEFFAKTKKTSCAVERGENISRATTQTLSPQRTRRPQRKTNSLTTKEHEEKHEGHSVASCNQNKQNPPRRHSAASRSQKLNADER
jgi:hypothetical protein